MDFFNSLAIFVSIFIGLCMLYFALSIRKFSAEFRYMKLRFGKPIRWMGRSEGIVSGGGLGIVWWLVEDVFTVPTLLDRIDLGQQLITTKKKIIGGETFSAVDGVRVDPVVYFSWPDDFDGMKNAYQSAPAAGFDPFTGKEIPSQRDELKGFVDKAMKGLIRRTLGDLSWYEIRTGRERTAGDENGKELGDILSEKIEALDNNPLKKAGMEDVLVEIEEVILPAGIGEAMSKPQIAAYEADAVRNKAGGEADAKRKMAEALAFEKEQVAKVIQRLGKAGSLVYTWDKLVEASHGTSNTLFFQVPSSVSNFIEQKAGVPVSNELVNKVFAAMKKMKEEGGLK